MDTPTPPPLWVQPIGVFPVDKTTTLPQNIVGDRVRSDCTSGVISSTTTTNLQTTTTTTTTTTEKMGGEKSTKEFHRSPSSSSSFLYLQTGSPTKKQPFQRPIPSVAKAKMKKNPAPLGNEMVHNTSPPPPPCTECGKTFRTLKSLFGHMRSHPERSWRGIKPPANCQRPPSLPPPPVLNFNFTQTEQEVASALILLGRSPPRFAIDRAHGRRGTRRRRENNRTSSRVPPPSKSTGIQVPVLEIDLNHPPLPGHSNDGIDSDTLLDLKLGL